MTSILRASQEFEGSAWAAYNAAYRRQAAATGLKDWGKVNSSLYSVCFTGKARCSQRCEMRLSTAHRTSECYAGEEEGTDVVGQARAVESALLAFSGSQGGVARRGRRSAKVCRLYNEKRCSAASETASTDTYVSGVAALTPGANVGREQSRNRVPSGAILLVGQ